MSTYLIWSNQHGAWWRPRRAGYTTVTLLAGRYDADEADEILREANFNPSAPPNEVKCLAPPAAAIVDEMQQAVSTAILSLDHHELIQALEEFRQNTRGIALEEFEKVARRIGR